MNRYFIGIFLLLLSLQACKAKKELVQKDSEMLEEKQEIYPSYQVSAAEIDKADLLYSLRDSKIEGNFLLLDVQYGGGCVRPHVFELQTNGIVGQDGFMNFHLLHKTYNDQCKALLMETLPFDISKLFLLESNVLKGIRINQLVEITF